MRDEIEAEQFQECIKDGEKVRQLIFFQYVEPLVCEV